MGVAADGYVIRSAVKLPTDVSVGVTVIAVIACHVVRGEFESHHFALARFDVARLCERDEIDRALLYTALGVRRGVIELNDVLARNISRVGHADLYGYLLRLLGYRRAGSGIRRNEFPVERRVGDAVAERILHNAVIARAVLVADVVPVALCVRRLVPLVTDVNVLGVSDVALGCGLSAGVCERRIGGKVVRLSVGHSARRVDLAFKYLGYGIRSRLTGTVDLHYRVYVVVMLEEVEVHRVTGVYKNYYLSEIGGHHVEKVLFVLGYVEIGTRLVRRHAASHAVLTRGVEILFEGKVRSLAAHSAENDYRDVGELLGVLKNGLAVLAHSRICVFDVRRSRARFDEHIEVGVAVERADARSLVAESGVHIHYFGIVVDPGLGKRVGQHLDLGAARSAVGVRRTVATEYPAAVTARPTEHVDVLRLVFGQRERGFAVRLLVFEEDYSLLGHLAAQLIRVLQSVCNGFALVRNARAVKILGYQIAEMRRYDVSRENCRKKQSHDREAHHSDHSFFRHLSLLLFILCRRCAPFIRKNKTAQYTTRITPSL